MARLALPRTVEGSADLWSKEVVKGAPPRGRDEARRRVPQLRPAAWKSATAKRSAGKAQDRALGPGLSLQVQGIQQRRVDEVLLDRMG
jgi:hypothetical protein